MSSRDAIEGLQPELLWRYFYEISQIPRCSKKEERITAYLEEQFRRLGLHYSRDKHNNLVARVPASRGRKGAPMVALQAHSDMVCEKNRGTAHDFDRDPIRLVRHGEWIGADGTTLGADNGIGVAAALAIASDPKVAHGPLEILITTDEETGLNGAKELSIKALKARYLLNLDTEEDGVFCIGCAGGVDTNGVFVVKTEPIEAEGRVALAVHISGLKGGHSGVDIHLGRANAIKLLARTLHELKPLKPRIASLQGGSKRNAIAREAEAVIVVGADQVKQVQARLAHCQEMFLSEFKTTDPDLCVSAEATPLPERVYTDRFAIRLLQLLLALPHGVVRMSADMEDLVETSTNLATVVQENGRLTVGTSQRSSVEPAKKHLAAAIAAGMKLAGAKVLHSDGYPGWQPNLNSHLLAIGRAAAERVLGRPPRVEAIHAGLECGLIGAKYPGMEMLSLGPTITGAHSPDERVHIPAVERFYRLLACILDDLSRPA
ncbi:MAG: aminoacyl-histidine dipeptidase [Saprospiraceae bacterium]|nr:aminoacyl-histidine dipeptidase [Saprospiraceae bacterium]MDW8230682.1 aminoacyl-histidine dipeptidase [Saprospiraceae bacterium]